MSVSYKEGKVLEVIGEAYEAALDPGKWTRVLDSLVNAIGAGGAVLYDYDDRAGKVGFGFFSGVGPGHAKSFAATYAAMDPWRVAAASLPEGSVRSGQSLVANSTLIKTEYFTQWLQPQDARHGLCAVVRSGSRSVAHVELFRPVSAGPFRAPARAFLRKVVPHLRRAMSLGQYAETLEVTRSVLGKALDGFNLGLALIDAEGRSVYVNGQVGAMIASGDGLVLRSGELTASAAADAARLRSSIARALGRGEVEAEGDDDQPVAISRRSRRRPYLVTVQPVSADEPEGDGQGVNIDANPSRPAAAVFIYDPERKLDLREATIARQYGLTPAEVGVVAGLVNGRSLQDIATDRGVSKNTVRSHLQRIFDKTNTNRQAQLVKLILSGPAAVGATFAND